MKQLKITNFSITTILLLLLVIVIAIPFGGCDFFLTNPSTSKKILLNTGYHQIKLHGYSWLGCSKSDWFATKFSALSANNKKVRGSVCCGLVFKNCTIRYSL